MKSSIFNKSFDEVFTNERLSFEAKRLKLSIDIKNFFDFAPHKTFLISKNEKEFTVCFRLTLLDKYYKQR